MKLERQREVRREGGREAQGESREKENRKTKRGEVKESDSNEEAESVMERQRCMVDV